MEFHEKLQVLRRRKALTQEELATALYVSRAAVSKWESGRGYPSIDSLKAIAAFFSVTVDDLLSGDELLTNAEEERARGVSRVRDLVFGALDCGASLLLFLPLFAERTDSGIRAVSLLSLTGGWIWYAYLAILLATVTWGILTFALRDCRKGAWERSKRTVSLLLGAVGAGLFMLGLHPYATVFLFVFLGVKGILLRGGR